MHSLRGKFLVFEGPDGSGKTTQFRRFLATCQEAGITVCEVREPGGTGVGERIRDILLDRAHEDMSLRCEMMLYMASRAQLVEQRIKPALARHELVAADRFVSSTLAYQGSAGGMPLDEIKQVAAIATGGVLPDLVVIFDVDEDTAAARMNPLLESVTRQGKGLDRMEAKGREFHAKVRQGYIAQARENPARHLVVDAAKSPEDVWHQLLDGLRTRFPK
jgi:dTMP kinase